MNDGIILLDTREQKKEYVQKYLQDIGGINTSITCLSHGADYLIINGNQSIGVQRKTSDEIFQQMQAIQTDIIPALQELTDAPVLLIEEQFHVDRNGHMYRRMNGFLHEVGLTATSYYNFINSIRLLGCEVVCTRNLEQSIWWMASTFFYIGKEHYPKQKKGHNHAMQAIGALCCINNFGITSSKKLLKDYTIKDLVMMDDKELRSILNVNQYVNFCKVRDAKVIS
jgi:hypothetical protein